MIFMYWFYDVSFPLWKVYLLRKIAPSFFFSLGTDFGAPDLCKMPWRRGKCVALSLPWRWDRWRGTWETTGYKGMICWKNMTGWCFQICFMFTPTCGNDPIWLIFFKLDETTNQMRFWDSWDASLRKLSRWLVCDRHVSDLKVVVSRKFHTIFN